MMKFRENEDAVSPVIGVILMVAITVILAAVIAAFVFGMTGSMESTKVVSMQAKLDDENITLTISGGPDLSSLQAINITMDGDPLDLDGKNSSVSIGLTGHTGGKVNGTFKVGDMISFDKGDGGRLLVVGKWADGTEQIILDKNF